MWPWWCYYISGKLLRWYRWWPTFLKSESKFHVLIKTSLPRQTNRCTAPVNICTPWISNLTISGSHLSTHAKTGTRVKLGLDLYDDDELLGQTFTPSIHQTLCGQKRVLEDYTHTNTHAYIPWTVRDNHVSLQLPVRYLFLDRCAKSLQNWGV